jgi:gluconolactonase
MFVQAGGMKIPQLPALLLAFAGTIQIMTAQTNNEMPDTVAPGATLQKLSNDFKFTEGPSCDAQGNVYFTDQPNNRIMKWSTDGKLSVFLEPSGHANGMNFDAKGNLIACADEKTALWSITPDGGHTILVDSYDGKKLNGPNDVWVMPDGSMYITDPYYHRDWWDYQQRPQDSEEVYYLAPGGKELKRVTTDLHKPNGIAATPDGKILYVSDIGAGQTWAYDPQPDGTLANKRLICSLGSDGMTIDNEGNLYLTGRGVTVFDAKGKKLGHIAVREPWTANVCFGGKDKQTLFITASTALYSIQMRVKGGWQAK